jgi:hypothetical protein
MVEGSNERPPLCFFEDKSRLLRQNLVGAAHDEIGHVYASFLSVSLRASLSYRRIPNIPATVFVFVMAGMT